MRQVENTAYWDRVAQESVQDPLATHRDLQQRELELDLIAPHLEPGMSVLEVGCGDGYVTEFLCPRVAHVDGFDASEGMIERARLRLEGRNCSLLVKALPSPSPEGLRPRYDAAVSVRVLINLEDRRAQEEALAWIAGRLRSGGTYLLLEGWEEGMDELDRLRTAAGLRPIERASYNLNLRRDWLEEVAAPHFEVAQRGSLGTYDFLTRVFYPLLVGEENVRYNTRFHEAAAQAARIAPDAGLPPASRLIFYKLIRR
jgi:SAM-dependent methyltransferase